LHSPNPEPIVILIIFHLIKLSRLLCTITTPVNDETKYNYRRYSQRGLWGPRTYPIMGAITRGVMGVLEPPVWKSERFQANMKYDNESEYDTQIVGLLT